MIKELYQTDPLETYAGKWKNLYFSKCGKTGFGESSYDSYVGAKEGFDRWRLSSFTGERWGAHFSNGVKMQMQGSPQAGYIPYSHTIQIPWK